MPHNGQESTITFTFEGLSIRRLPQGLALFGRQPIAESDPQLLYTLDPTDAGRQIRTEKPAVRRLISKPAYGAEPQVYRSGCELPGFQVNAIAEHHGLVEGEARLRAIPIHELIDGVPVSALGFGASQAIENGSFGVIQIGQSEGQPSEPCVTSLKNDFPSWPAALHDR